MLIAIVVTLTVCFVEKLGKIYGCCQIQHNFKCIESIRANCAKNI